MYSTCLFCHGPLGANEVVETFPVGRRLAFDAARGRLWVVCRRCEKWNLSPLEERWESLDTCERLFRDARKRVSTDQIGLARLSEGLELVRIGEPQRPEFAAWRYGDQFGRRRRRRIVMTVAATGVGLGMILAGPIFGGVGSAAYTLYEAGGWAFLRYRKRRVVASFTTADGRMVEVRSADAERTTLFRIGDEGWGISVPLGAKGDQLMLDGGDARRAAAILLPHITTWGGTAKETRAAVQRIEEVGDPERFLLRIAGEPKSRNLDPRIHGWKRAERSRVPTLNAQGAEVCLAVEMAVNEENERRALEGELAMLEQAWKDAEEIAAISDSLTLPEEVRVQLGRLKRVEGGQGD